MSTNTNMKTITAVLVFSLTVAANAQQAKKKAKPMTEEACLAQFKTADAETAKSTPVAPPVQDPDDPIFRQKLENEISAARWKAWRIKSENDIEARSLEKVYSHNLISVDDYFDKKKALEIASVEAEKDALEKEMAIQKMLIELIGKKIKENEAADKLTAERKQACAPVKSAAKIAHR